MADTDLRETSQIGAWSLKNGAAFSVVVEEALIAGDLTCIAQWIKEQPPWSDFPIVVLTSHGNAPGRQTIADRLLDVLGNVSFLERPFHPSTLVSIARSALRLSSPTIPCARDARAAWSAYS